MQAFVTAGAGFLLAVLWFDLMFDIQMLRHRRLDPPSEVVDSIARYYQRVTTEARPMNRLIVVAMLGTLVAIVVELIGDVPRWAAWPSLVLAVAPIGLARVRTVPNAVRLGQRAGDFSEQAARAVSILYDHLFCFAAIAALVALQLASV